MVRAFEKIKVDDGFILDPSKRKNEDYKWTSNNMSYMFRPEIESHNFYRTSQYIMANNQHATYFI